MLVHFVTDEPAKIPAIRALLEPRFHISPRVLGGGESSQSGGDGILLVDADLRQRVRVEQIRSALQSFRDLAERLFVVRNGVRSMVNQAYALGATAVVSRPKEIVATLADIEQRQRAHPEACSQSMSSAAAFASMFATVRAGRPIHLPDAEYVTAQIINSITSNGLTAWLDDVRRYHEGTFQHCLLVTGVAVGFALDLRFTKEDVRRLGMAATLHDVGKARIPLAILDKPGRLDPSEEQTMRQHPVIGYDLLKDLPGISPEILDGVRHHHEYLDGSGYPDGLKAPEISDLTRLLTISDIFAALIEERPYRPAMRRQEAYNILSGMDGKLEPELVGVFRKTALDDGGTRLHIFTIRTLEF